MEQVNQVVYVVKTEILTGDLQELIDLLNKNELAEGMQLDDEDLKPLLTLEEVLGNPELLAYLCEALVMKEHDVDEAWNQDGFCDFADYRK